MKQDERAATTTSTTGGGPARLGRRAFLYAFYVETRGAGSA